MTVEVFRYAVFTSDGSGGRPAGVVLGADVLADAQMSAVAQAIGYPRTAFLLASGEAEDGVRARYLSPRAELSSSGTATIAAAVAHATRFGTGRLRLLTAAGPLVVDTEHSGGGISATLTLPRPSIRPVAPSALAALLTALGWTADDLHPRYRPQVVANGTGSALVVATSAATPARSAARAGDLDDLIARERWTTMLALAAESSGLRWCSLLPGGDAVEEPAAGLAEWFGGYLAALGHLAPGEEATLLQGSLGGPPTAMVVALAADRRSILLSGTATPLPLSVYDDQEPL